MIADGVRAGTLLTLTQFEYNQHQHSDQHQGRQRSSLVHGHDSKECTSNGANKAGDIVPFPVSVVDGQVSRERIIASVVCTTASGVPKLY